MEYEGVLVVESSVAELHETLNEYDMEPTFIVGYVSPYVDIDLVGKILNRRFPDVPKSLCSSAGELLAIKEALYCETGHYWDRVVLQCFDSSIIEDAEVVSIPLDCEDLRQGRVAVSLEKRIERLRRRILELDITMRIRHQDTLALTFFDGVSNSESFFLEALYDSGRFPCLFIGGSAGGKLDFHETWIHDGSRALKNHAVISFLKMAPGIRFGIFKSQNFTPTGTSFSILSASVELRHVSQVIDAQGHISSLVDALCMSFQCHPSELEAKMEDYSFAIRVGEELFIRSVSRIDPEMNLVRFYCDLSAGEELLIVKRDNLEKSTQRDFRRFLKDKAGLPVAGILNDCILRRLYYEQKKFDMGHIFQSPGIAGFSTFGETLGLYLNQTLTAIFFFRIRDGETFHDEFIDNFPIHYGEFRAFYLKRKVAKLEGLSNIVVNQIEDFKKQRYTRRLNPAGMDATMVSVVEGLNNLGQFLEDAEQQRLLKVNQIEEALRDSEERFRLLSESALTGIYLIQDNQFTYVNNAFARMFGYEVEEILSGMPLLNLVHPDDRQLVLNNIRRRESGKRQYIRYTFRGQRKNGSIFYLEVHGGRIIFRGKVGVIGTFVDVTEQKKAEADLQASEANYRDLYNKTPSMFFTIDSKGMITAVNDFASDRLHYAKAELQGNLFLNLFPENDRKKVRDDLKECASNCNTVVTWQQRKICKNGMPIWCEDFARTVTDLEGNEKFLIVSQDITERKKLEASLRVSQFIFDQASIGIFLIDSDNCIVDVNTHACRSLGYRKEELYGRSMLEIDPQADAAEPADVTNGHDERKSTTITTTHRRKNGEVFPVQMFVSYVLHEGEPVRVVFAKDVSDLEKARIEKEKLKVQLEQVQKLEAIGRLAGGIAHDLNNLLTPILGYADMLSNDTSLNTKVQKRVSHISQAALGARELVRQLLAFSRKQVLENKLLDLGQLVDDFSILLRRTVRENIELIVRQSPEAKPIYADQGQIEQVLMNLVVNASDAMPDGGRLSIETKLVELDGTYTGLPPDSLFGDYILLSVGDTGIGMDEATLERIYEPFFSTKGERGTGLGLATVYGIVKQHEGSISVYSEPGIGTTFRIYLPVSKHRQASCESEKDVAPSPRGTETILLVEDNGAVRTTVRDILRQNGYRVIEAENGEAALKVVRRDTLFSLLLTDVIMPGMNGRELFALLAAKQPSLKALYMSGYMDDVIAHHGVLDEGVQFIQKPFSSQAILRKVRDILDT